MVLPRNNVIALRLMTWEDTMETPEYRLRLMHIESENLGHCLQMLPTEVWNQPSACQRWAMHDVVGHLIWAAELYTTMIRRGLHGDVTPLDGWPDAGSVNAASAAPLLEQLGVTRRQELGEALLPTFHATSTQLQQVLAGVHQQAWETACYHPAGLLPARFFVDLRLTEIVMHGWDIRSRFEPTAALARESLPAFLDVLTAAIGWAFWPGPSPAQPVRYRFVLTGTPERCLDIVVDREGARLEEGSTDDAHVRYHCCPETFVLVMYGRLGVMDALAQGRLQVDGDTTLVTAFAKWFRGV
jgi:uncharacterized protein (TIGR03083 family)